MKKLRFLMFVLTIATFVLSACGGVAATPTAAGGKVEAMPVAFIGIIDSIAGDQWVISGTTATVGPTVVRDGPFSVGDQVKVEGLIEPDGSFTVSRVEVPSPQDISTLPQFGDTNTNDANANDNANINDGNINDANINDGNINDGNINDDNGNGVNSNDDNSNAANSNDANSNDDNSNSANSNDNNGGGNTDNSNDDNSGGGNSGKGGDSGNSGKGGGDDDNGDDHGGNSNDD